MRFCNILRAALIFMPVYKTSITLTNACIVSGGFIHGRAGLTIIANS
jgi:hypothetical protein